MIPITVTLKDAVVWIEGVVWIGGNMPDEMPSLFFFAVL
jgi:hypothetical protein